MPTPSEMRKLEEKYMTKKQKRKQILKMIFAAFMVGAIFILGYALIFIVGLFFFS